MVALRCTHVPIYAIQEKELEILVANAQHVKKDSSDPCYPVFSDNLTYPIPVSRLDRSKTVVVLCSEPGRLDQNEANQVFAKRGTTRGREISCS
jgi:hypothetical protein